VAYEFYAWLGRARYDRRPEHPRGLENYGEGLRNGFRPRTVQTAEGELEVEIPQVREAAERSRPTIPADTQAIPGASKAGPERSGGELQLGRRQARRQER
jgi:hypothetical protein